MELIYENKVPAEKVIRDTKPAKCELDIGNEWNNLLFFGNNLNVLKSLYNTPTIQGKVKLAYIDPPFATEREFADYEKNHAYSDKLNGHEYVEFLRQRLIFLKELLSEDGSIYVHLDQKKGHYIKIIMDEIFGEFNFKNDITRIKCNPKNFERKAFGNIKDSIYFYSNNPTSLMNITSWNDVRTAFTKEDKENRFDKISNDGRRYTTTPLHAPGETANGPTGREWKGMMPPKGRHWRYGPDELTRLDKLGLIEWSSTGNPRKIIYADEMLGKKTQDVWEFKDPGLQYSEYPTEKNFDMLKMIIRTSSNEGDLVLDCFAGSGTTLMAADELGRKWIGIDSSSLAIKTIKTRLETKLHATRYRIIESIEARKRLTAQINH